MPRLAKLLVVLGALIAAEWTAAQQSAPLFESDLVTSHLAACKVADGTFRECAGKTHKCHASVDSGYDGSYCMIQCGVCGMNPDMGTLAEGIKPATHSSPLYINDGVYLNRETDVCLLPTNVDSEKTPGSCYLQAIRTEATEPNVMCFDMKKRKTVTTLVSVTYNDLSTNTFERGLAHDTLWYIPMDTTCSRVMADRNLETILFYCYKATPIFRTWNFFQCYQKVFAKSIKLLVTPDLSKQRPQRCQMFVCEVSVGFSYWTCALGWYPDLNPGSGEVSITFGCRRCKDRCKDHECPERGKYCPQCPTSPRLKARGKSCMLPCPMGCADQADCDRWASVCTECVPFRYGPLCDKACERCLTKCHRVDGTCTGGECIPGRWGLDANCEKTCPEGCHLSCSSTNGSCQGCDLLTKYGPSCNLDCPSACKGGVCDWSGRCLECQRGKFGDACNQHCTGQCAADYCMPNGTCYTTCNTAGTWGTTCQYTCPSNCQLGKCEKSTGNCIGDCTPGHLGLKCEESCELACVNRTCYEGTNGRVRACKGGCTKQYWSFTCGQQCPSNCLNLECRTEGDTYYCTQGCAEGFTGRDCKTSCHGGCTACTRHSKYDCTECVAGFYGIGCRYLCHYGCVDTCSVVSGACDRCKPGHWGPTCSKTCKNCKEATCQQLTGVCPSGCYSGFHGARCDLACSPNCLGQICHPDGACMFGCTGDFTGPKCDWTPAPWYTRYWFIIFLLTLMLIQVYGSGFFILYLEQQIDEMGVGLEMYTSNYDENAAAIEGFFKEEEELREMAEIAKTKGAAEKKKEKTKEDVILVSQSQFFSSQNSSSATV